MHTLADGSVLPVAEDLRRVHRLLKASAGDHLDGWHESFPEFVQRLREDPGHRWDHWWIATARGVPCGALVGTVTPLDAHAVLGAFVDYLGVPAQARDQGVAQALVHSFLMDVRDRGRNRVSVEVQSEGRAGIADLYKSLGWSTEFLIGSWHKVLDLPGLSDKTIHLEQDS